MKKPSVTRRKIPLRSRRRRGTQTIRTPCFRSHQYWLASRASRRMQSGLQRERPRGPQEYQHQGRWQARVVSRRRRRRARARTWTWAWTWTADGRRGRRGRTRTVAEAKAWIRCSMSVPDVLFGSFRIRVKHVCYYSRLRQIILPIRQILREAGGPLNMSVKSSALVICHSFMSSAFIAAAFSNMPTKVFPELTSELK